jgi:hypothetical protein
MAFAPNYYLCVVKQARYSTEPDAHGGPPGSSRRQAPRKQGRQTAQLLWQGPLFSTRVRLLITALGGHGD